MINLNEIVSTEEGESDILDFKESFNNNNSDWLELIKDIVAMANSGGGNIVIGIDDDGQLSGKVVDSILSVDPADITNKIFSFTGINFSNFRIIECYKENTKLALFRIGTVVIPIVFVKPGNYQLENGKQKNAFSVGSVYFRHGAKSEPCTSDDLRYFLEREIARTKSFWLDGIGKIVEAPYSSRVEILPQEIQQSNSSTALPIRIVDDPSAPAYKAFYVDDTHPLRQKDVIDNVNMAIGGILKITSYNIQCIRRVHNVDNNIMFCYKIKYASPRFSNEFVKWIINEYNLDNSFFNITKHKYDTIIKQKNITNT